MNFPHWIDPTPQTRAFIAGFAGLPVREPFRGGRAEIRLARIEFDEEMRIQREIRKAQIIDRLRDGARKAADKRLAAVIADLLPGETFSAREKRKKREMYQKNKAYYAARYQAKKAAKIASGSNALRVGGTGEESSSPDAGAE